MELQNFVCVCVCVWPHCTAFTILVPQPGIEHGLYQWKRGVVTTGPPGNSCVPKLYLRILLFSNTQSATANGTRNKTRGRSPWPIVVPLHSGPGSVERNDTISESPRYWILQIPPRSFNARNQCQGKQRQKGCPLRELILIYPHGLCSLKRQPSESPVFTLPEGNGEVGPWALSLGTSTTSGNAGREGVVL